MLLPTTATGVLVALVISLLGWGLWACFYKATRRIRFEYLAYDFTWGVVVAAVGAAFILGLWDSKELTFQDNFLLTGLRKIAWVLAAGVAFNVANMLLLAATSVSRMSVAFPIAFSFAWAIASIWDYVARPALNPIFALGGALVMIVAAALAYMAYRSVVESEAAAAAEALKVDPKAKAAPAADSGLKGFILAVLAGIFFTLFFAALQEGISGDNGVASYGAALVLSVGVFGSTIVLVPFFLNFPVRGKPLAVRQYFKLERRQHVMGIIAGIVWTAGLLGGLVTFGLPANILPSPVTVYMLNHSAPLLTALCGLMLFGEFREAPSKAYVLMGATFVLMLAGMGLIAMAPMYGS